MSLSYRRYLRGVLLFIFPVFILVAICAVPGSAYARANPKYAALVMDADTGMILFQRYADKKVHPASLTKIMTLLLAFEAMEQKRLSLYQRIKISKHAANMVPSKLGLAPGSSIRVQDAIFALVTKSANDVAVAMAEQLGGSERNFAKMMTAKAREIGMRNTTFKNASGLHHPYQVSTARDMAILGRYVISRYPDQYKYFSKAKFTYDGKTYRNHNRLLGKYKGMDGMKTGYIQASGFNLMASAVQSNRRLIGVVFGGRTSKTRNAHMAKILDQSFRKIRDMRIAQAKVPIPDRKPDSNYMLASLNQVVPASGDATASSSFLDENGSFKWNLLNPTLQTGMFRQIIGEGDYDPAVSKRIETGLIAIAAHKGEAIPKALTAPTTHARSHAAKPKMRPVVDTAAIKQEIDNNSWGIQIGAFSSRAASDKALQKTLASLPGQFSNANPIIAPLKTAQGYMFRARLNGLSAREAQTACTAILKDCLILAPNAY